MEAADMSIKKARDWFAGTEEKLSPKKAEIAHKIIKEIVERLSFLNNVGLDYLSLNRQSARFPAANRSAFAWRRKSAQD